MAGRGIMDGDRVVVVCVCLCVVVVGGWVVGPMDGGR